MKSERFNYLYFLFGILCGFLLGSSLDQETSVWVRRLLLPGAVFFVALLWRRIESRAHGRHLEQWEELRFRGKWYFILTRYVLVRGTVLFVVFAGPALSLLRFSIALAAALAIVGALLAPLLVYLGYQEWNDCERENEIRSLRQTAEFISSKQN